MFPLLVQIQISNLGKIAFSSEIKYHSIKDISLRGSIPSQDELGSFDSYMISFALNTGISVSDNFAIGVSYKSIKEKYYIDTKSDIVLSLGAVYKLGQYDIYGAYENSELLSDQEILPRTFSFGVRTRSEFLGVGAEIRELDDDFSSHVYVDKPLNKYLKISAGYVINSDHLSWSSGLELKMNSISMLFAYAAHKKLSEYKLFQFSILI